MSGEEYRACLVEDIKDMASMIADNAQDIVGDMDGIAKLIITIEFSGDGTIPTLRVTREHLPAYAVLEAIARHRVEAKQIEVNKDLITKLYKSEEEQKWGAKRI